ncbi:MAG: hypothetical protein K1Y36_21240 [Blastocatellia bacterium]|nr:hypothetical protein [Blastocatellia bacterium]
MGKRPPSFDSLSEFERLTFRLSRLSEAELVQVHDFVDELETSRRRTPQPEIFEDELLGVLSIAPENIRARQVYAWEQIRRRAAGRGDA